MMKLLDWSNACFTMKKTIVCAMLLISSMAAFAGENDSVSFVEENVSEENDSDVFTNQFVDKIIDKIIRKKFYLDRGYRCFISAGLLFGKYPGARYSTTHGIQLNEKYFIGAGFGFNTTVGNYDGHDYIPLFSEFRVDFLSKNISPFVDVRGGYAIVIEENRGFYANVSCGLRLKRFSVSLGVDSSPGLKESDEVDLSRYMEDPNDENRFPSRIWNLNTRISFEFDKYKR